jgi:hypothetical protein
MVTQFEMIFVNFFLLVFIHVFAVKFKFFPHIFAQAWFELLYNFEISFILFFFECFQFSIRCQIYRVNQSANVSDPIRFRIEVLYILSHIHLLAIHIQ